VIDDTMVGSEFSALASCSSDRRYSISACSTRAPVPKPRKMFIDRESPTAELLTKSPVENFMSLLTAWYW